jgi:hypothetical protein
LVKKIIISLLATLSILVLATLTVGAAPATAAATQVGPFEGEFHGYLYGDDDSRAPISLDLTHRGRTVKGTAILGKGLIVDGKRCGEAAIPAGAIEALGQTSATNRNHLTATSSFEVSGIEVTVELDGTVSRDGRTVNAEAKIDLPWLCGRDPILTGTLSKAQ